MASPALINVTKSFVPGSTNIVGSFTFGGVVTLNASNLPLDTARRISVVGTSPRGPSVVLNGKNQNGLPITENIITSATPGTAVMSKQDFLTVTSVTVSSV